MIDVTAEPPLTLREAARLPFLKRNGRAPHVATLYRWMKPGLGGARLETVKVGGSCCTSEAALIRFFHRLTTGEPLAVRTPRHRNRDMDRAERELDGEGWK